MFKPLGWQLNFRGEHLRAIFHSTLHELVTVEAFKHSNKKDMLREKMRGGKIERQTKMLSREGN